MAITTKYNGIEYRSRLEARWAAFMRNIGWDITYEPFDGDGYIPDFLVQGPRPFLVEVKPAVTLAEYQAAIPKAEAGLARHWKHDILIVGTSPFPPALHEGQCRAFNEQCMSCRDNAGGLLGEYQGWFSDDNGGGYYPEEDWEQLRRGFSNRQYIEHPNWAWDAGVWGDDCACHRVSITHSIQSYRTRPCDCYDGNLPLLRRKTLLESMWADACNDVKWRGRAA